MLIIQKESWKAGVDKKIIYAQKKFLLLCLCNAYNAVDICEIC